MGRWLAALIVPLAAAAPPVARAEPVSVVAAESFYGALASDIGGGDVRVITILSSPDQDPHAFEASASAARAIANARLVVYNGAGYDAWMAKLLAASRSSARETIEVARLGGCSVAGNPHVWYDARTMSALAREIEIALSRVDPAHRASYAERRAAFDRSMRPLAERIDAMRARYAGTPVSAVEPVFGCMADALGLAMRNAGFQLAVMNGTEPSARDIAAMERDLRSRAVRALIFNRQSSGPLAQRMRSLASASGVAVVGVTETQPPGMTYPQWMLAQLDALDAALAKPRP
jgi:zinc/manganese transport system substrate-binding protein